MKLTLHGLIELNVSFQGSFVVADSSAADRDETVNVHSCFHKLSHKYEDNKADVGYLISFVALSRSLLIHFIMGLCYYFDVDTASPYKVDRTDFQSFHSVIFLS